MKNLWHQRQAGESGSVAAAWAWRNNGGPAAWHHRRKFYLKFLLRTSIMACSDKGASLLNDAASLTAPLLLAHAHCSHLCLAAAHLFFFFRASHAYRRHRTRRADVIT